MAEALRKNTIDRNDPGFKAWLNKIERGVEAGLRAYEKGETSTPDEVRAFLKEKSEHARNL